MEYEDIDQKERKIMHSLGYIWNGHDWQRAFDDDDGGMIVEGWTGGKPHIWDQRIAEINANATIDFKNDDIPPFSQEAKEIYRRESDESIKVATAAIKDLEMEIQTTLNDIEKINKNLTNKNLTKLDKASLEFIVSKLYLRKKRLTLLRNEAKKSELEQEHKKNE